MLRVADLLETFVCRVEQGEENLLPLVDLMATQSLNKNHPDMSGLIAKYFHLEFWTHLLFLYVDTF